MAKRKIREKLSDKELDLLKPIDMLSLGSDDDVCFGKHHDLLAPECKECGDSEFCAIVKAQGLHQERLNIEAKQRFKDVEEADEEMVKRKIKAKQIVEKYKKNRFKRLKTILIVSKKLNLPKSVIKQIYDQN